jgi:nucleotide-binding universal stress UspA family protein
MNMWKKLLVPHDFSPCAERALGTALELAKVHGSELALVHISDLPANLPLDTLVTPPGGAGPLRVDEYTTRGARQRLDAIAEPLRRAGFVVTTLAVTGDVAEQILALATEVGADAVIVGTHGRQGLSHFWLGSVAEKVVRSAPVPVVCVRTPAREATPTREESDIEDELAG